MKKRSKLEIYLDLLKAVSKHSRLTRIGNQANLSWKDTVKHLSFLEERGFVKAIERNNQREYVLTQRGSEVLVILEKIAKALSRRSPMVLSST
ncbi:MAG: hypothetical protein DRJ30_07570 [Candidatus Methanomethylicota archaeon]|nr:MAG: hypothetical protein DRJ30_07570 [Candidatus Verstraetearchaeota archaeon]